MPRLKLASGEAFLTSIPLCGAFANAHLIKTAQTSVIVRLRSADGVEGLGDVDPTPGYTLEKPEEILATLRAQLFQALSELDPLNILRVVETIEKLHPRPAAPARRWRRPWWTSRPGPARLLAVGRLGE